MPTTTKKLVVVAFNGIFAVSQQRSGDFLAAFSDQVERCMDDTRRKGQPSLVSCVLGESLEATDDHDDVSAETAASIDSTIKFHCHFKLECTCVEEAVAVLDKSLPFCADADDDEGPSSSSSHPWRDFEATAPFVKPPVWNAWTVAPSSTDHAIPNPKPTTDPLFCLNADLYIRPEIREEFLALMAHARSESIQESLCVEYQYGESITTPNTFHVHQAYRGDIGGKEGFDNHAKTPHYQKWKAFSNKKDGGRDPFTQDPQGHTFRPAFVVPKSQQQYASPSSSEESTQQNNPEVILLDGGNGHELKQRGVIQADGSFLAGLLANEQQPEVVQSVHHDFLQQAGCHVITTNSFVAVPDRIQRDFGLQTKEDVHERTRQLIQAAVHCAQAAARQCEPHRKVAGTVPPLTECYVASLVPTNNSIDESLVPTYKFLLETLIQAGVDILLAETLSTTREAVAIVRALSKLHQEEQQQSVPPLWIAWTIDDFNDNPTTLRSGESLEVSLDTVLQEAQQQQQQANKLSIGALGVNCASPSAVTRAIPILAQAAKNSIQQPQPKVLAYANAFQTTTSEYLAEHYPQQYIHSRKDIQTLKDARMDNHNNKQEDVNDSYDSQGVLLPEAYARHAKQWKILGASIIGGCCGCSPSHLKAVANQLGYMDR